MKIQLTISLLASANPEALERCLDSLRPLMMQIPSELIIVFTGTDKRVQKVAARYTDQIYPFTWCNDFSAARNVGLKHAKGEWFLYIDDDEWFEDTSELINFFQSGEYLNYNSAFYLERNYLDWDGLRHFDFFAFRMAKRIPGLRFEGSIHEQLYPAYGPVKYFKDYVHHYGYVQNVNNTEGDKSSRNIPMLLKAISSKPDYLKNYLQITKEYCSEKEWEKAEQYCRKGRKLCQNEKNALDEKLWLQVYLATLLARKTDKKQAISEIESMLSTEKPSELARIMLYHFLISLYAELENPEETVRCGCEYEKLLEYMEKNPHIWEEQRYGDVNEYLAKDPKKVLASRLDSLSAALKIQDRKHAEYFLSLLPWEEEYQMQQYYPLFNQWKECYHPLFQELLESLPYDSSPYLLFQQALRSLEDNNTQETEYLFSRCMEKSTDFYLRQEIIRQAILNLPKIDKIAVSVDLDMWKACVESALQQIPDSALSKVEQLTDTMDETITIQKLWMVKLLLERKLTRGYLMNPDLTETLKEYGQSILKYYRLQYRDEMFEEEHKVLLPKECRFACLLVEAIEAIDKGLLAESVRLFRQALYIHPLMTGTINEVLRQLQMELNVPSHAGGDEFIALAYQLKEVLKEMIKKQQFKEAETIVTQLSTLLPKDLEVLRMRQIIFRQGT